MFYTTAYGVLLFLRCTTSRPLVTRHARIHFLKFSSGTSQTPKKNVLHNAPKGYSCGTRSCRQAESRDHAHTRRNCADPSNLPKVQGLGSTSSTATALHCQPQDKKRYTKSHPKPCTTSNRSPPPQLSSSKAARSRVTGSSCSRRQHTNHSSSSRIFLGRKSPYPHTSSKQQRHQHQQH